MTKVQELFISNLRRYRNRAGLSQLAFSEKIDVSPNYLNSIEHGRGFPSVDLLQRIVDYLDISPYELFVPPIPDKNTETERITRLKQQINELFDKVLLEED